MIMRIHFSRAQNSSPARKDRWRGQLCGRITAPENILAPVSPPFRNQCNISGALCGLGVQEGRGRAAPASSSHDARGDNFQNFTKSTNFATVPRRRKIFLLHIRHHTDTSAPWTAPRAILGGNGRLLKKILCVRRPALRYAAPHRGIKGPAPVRCFIRIVTAGERMLR